MKKIKSILAVALMLALCVCCFAGCSGSSDDVTDTTESMKIEDGEDVGIGAEKITIVNLTGKDAVQLLARVNGTDEWKNNILSADSLNTNVEVEFDYIKVESNVFDIRLVFEDGTTQDFTAVDFDKANGTIYLGTE